VIFLKLILVAKRIAKIFSIFCFVPTIVIIACVRGRIGLMPSRVIESYGVAVNVREPIPVLRTIHARDQRIRLQKAVDIRRNSPLSTREKKKVVKVLWFLFIYAGRNSTFDNNCTIDFKEKQIPNLAKPD